MSTDVSTNAACSSGKSHDGPITPKKETQAISTCPSDEDDAQILSTSSGFPGFPNYSTYPILDHRWRELFRSMAIEVWEEKREAYLKKMEFVAESEENPNHQAPEAAGIPIDNNPVQKDEELTQVPTRSNPPLVAGYAANIIRPGSYFGL